MSSQVNITTGNLLMKRRDRQVGSVVVLPSYIGTTAETTREALLSLSDIFELVNAGEANEYLRIKKPVAGDFEIQAFSDSGQMPPSVWSSLPVASATVPGVIKIGANLTIVDGVLNAATGGVNSWNDLTDKPSTFPPSTHSNTDHSEHYVTSDELAAGLAGLVDSSPATLDTLNELAAALGDDPNFATTVSNAIGLRALIASPTFTGTVTIPSLIINDLSDSFMPYRVAATDKLGNSPVQTDGTNVGIGLSPNYKLDIKAVDNSAVNIAARFHASSEISNYLAGTKVLLGNYTAVYSMRKNNSNDIGLYFQTTPDISSPVLTDSMALMGDGSLSVRGNISSLGEVTAYSASDRRLKTNVSEFLALELIERLNPVKFNWNNKAKTLNALKGDRTNYGLIAQDIEGVLPELIHPIFINYKAVDYIGLIPILIQAIKEQQLLINKHFM